MVNKVDKNIIDQVSKGDLKSFEMLFRNHYEMLCTYAVKFVHDPDTAEEIVQELFYTLWEKRSYLKIKTSLKSYLYASVHNRCLKHIRHQTVESNYRDYYYTHQSEIETTPEDITQSEELQKIVNNTLDNLPERCGKIFRLNRFEGLKYHEIAERLSISVKTVEANMGKALRLLRRNLKDYIEVV